MFIGGVLIGAGMELNLLPGDYLFGETNVKFMIGEIVCIEAGWVVLDGFERPTATTAWRNRRVRVRIEALKHSLSLV